MSENPNKIRKVYLLWQQKLNILSVSRFQKKSFCNHLKCRNIDLYTGHMVLISLYPIELYHSCIITDIYSNNNKYRSTRLVMKKDCKQIRLESSTIWKLIIVHLYYHNLQCSSNDVNELINNTLSNFRNMSSLS